MNRPLALFDIDKTMFNGFSYFPLLESQVQDNIARPETLQQANDSMAAYADGQLAYEGFVKVLLDIYAGGLEGRPEDEIADSTQRFFDETGDFFGYVQPTIDVLRPSHDIALVTGGTQFTAQAVAKVFDIEVSLSSIMAVKGGHLSGVMASYLATADEKRVAIRHLTEAHPFEGSLGFGDSEGDIEMLRAVELPICVRPSEGLRDIGQENGWAIVDSPDELMSGEGLLVVRQLTGQ